ncbi:hypothetical protein P43SY_005119 [Pythium insidiosum]|uniref:GPI-anchored leucine-rich lipoprotein n=1 Tax=Pythium insidiosum TaxID=114742 RepID=A0AAD5LTP5_PYTIN|nr:hypothetical protein P43SY_005119 [Pythium insidiosum]
MARLRAAFALLSALLSSTVSVSAYRPGDEVCKVSPDNACPVDKLTLSQTDRSTLVYPGGKTRCAFDDWPSRPGTNFSTNATFFFQVFPNEKQDKRKVLLFMQGGGGCVDDYTCNFALQCSSSESMLIPNARALSAGILNRSDPANAFNDWNIVHIPYCTGDIHVGNRTLPSTESGIEAVLNRPMCLKQNQTMHLNGFNNADAAFKWALTNFPNPEHLVLGGASAGSLGAQLLGKYVGDLWGVEDKKIRYSVVADSYVGVVPENKPAGMLLNYYGACDLDFRLEGKKAKELMDKCKSEKLTAVELISTLIDETPTGDWLFIDSKADLTQRFFYELLRQGVFGFPFKDLISPEAFYANMTAILDVYKNESTRVVTFLVEGEEHVFLGRNEWYKTLRAETNETLGAIMRDVLAGNYTRESASSSGSMPGVSGASPVATPNSEATQRLLALGAVVVASILSFLS